MTAKALTQEIRVMHASTHSLQKMFEETSQEKVIELVLLKAVSELLDRYGIRLTNHQKTKLHRSIRSGNLKNVSIPLTKRQEELLGGKKLDLASLDDATLKKLHEETWNSFEPGLQSSVLAIVDSISPVFEREIRKRITVELKARGKLQATFEKQLKRRWRKALEFLQTLVFIAIEAGENAGSQMENRQPLAVQVLFRLHARACQIAHEIVTLLQAGFADGAHARWRTLHELAVTAFFISEHGDHIAERYVLHHGIETFKGAEQYQKYCQRLGYRALTKRQFSSVKNRRDRLIQRFGKSYNGEYGWADSIIQNGHPTFRDLEERVQLDHLRPFYKWACNNIHAGAKGAFERLGLCDDESNILLAGPSSIGLADPGHATAMSLSQITTCLLSVQPTLDNLVAMRVLGGLEKQVGEYFLRAHRAAERSVGS